MDDPEYAIYGYLQSNREALCDSQSELLQKKTELYSMESVEFHNEISRQYGDLIKYNITNEICLRLALDFETVYIVIEELNLEKFFSCEF